MSRCACAKPRPVEMTEETFFGLFGDTPISAERTHFCDSCGGTIEHENDGPYAVPEEFDDDGQCDFTQDDVVT